MHILEGYPAGQIAQMSPKNLEITFRSLGPSHVPVAVKRRQQTPEPIATNLWSAGSLSPSGF
jgi:hypothetical protein